MRASCLFVSKTFSSAATSDTVWERFLPSDYDSIISQSPSSASLLASSSSKKNLYFTLCDNPIIIDDGKKSFQLDRQSGKKCYMLAARDLYIECSGSSEFWVWKSLPESRFTSVAELVDVCHLEIRGKISTRMLSPKTHYAAYLVFKLMDGWWLGICPAEVSVGIFGGHRSIENVCLDPTMEDDFERPRIRHQQFFGLQRPRKRHQQFLGLQRPMKRHQQFLGLQRPRKRNDEWLEIKMGDFFNLGEEDEQVEMCVTEILGGDWKGGLVLEGIEVRPKEDN